MCLTAGAEDCDAVISMTAECSNQTNERSCAWVMASVVLYTCPCSHCCNLYQRTATLAQLRLTTASSFLFTVTRQQSPFHRHQVNLTVLHVARLSCKSGFSYAELLLLADNKWRRDTTWLRTQCVALFRTCCVTSTISKSMTSDYHDSALVERAGGSTPICFHGDW